MDDRRIGHTLAPLGHLAVFNALYSCACVALVGVWSAGPAWGGAPATGSIAYAGLLALSVYLLDRVKLRDAWLDPADLDAHPARMALLWPRRGLVRVAMVASGLGAVGLGASLGWELALMTPLAWLGVVAYANRAIVRPRPKDILVVKNLAVGGAHAAMAAVCVWASVAHQLRSLPAVLIGAGVLMLIVFADTALCDIPDRHADAAHNTQTFSVRFGARAAWAIAWGCLACASSLMLAIGLPRAPVAACALGLTQAALMLVPVRALRDAVDLRLPLVALILILAPTISP